ncbi:MAG: TIGR03663 family protein [Anaerolineales bacterium]|nr:TIGR03663 family protein [Anaerolineales bacterium]MCB9126969.1 TIGR03663 family protein [Ardenticatenales bacterium]MCB9171522.1 TIGR03663 family protein [Ardenticatenales bacterium]
MSEHSLIERGPVAAGPTLGARLRAVDWPLVLIASFVLLALLSRFWDLGSRALHHDESLHAVFSFYEYDRWGYQHDPLMHGPLLFHLTALGYWLFGVTDATARLWPALLGIAIVASPWFFRAWVGRRGAAATSLFLLISPTILYYSRFIRHDIFLAAWTLLIVYGIWRYLQRAQIGYLYLAGAGLALAFSQKEVIYLLSLIFFIFFVLVTLFQVVRGLRSVAAIRASRAWHVAVMIGLLVLPFTTAMILHLVGHDPAAGYTPNSYRNIAFMREAGAIVLALFALSVAAAALLWDWKRFLIAAAIFNGIIILLHTNFLTYPFGLTSGYVGALGYWIEQHGEARGDQPWFYYTMLIPLYEFLPLLITLLGGGWLLRQSWPHLRHNTPRYSEAAAQVDAAALWPWFNLWWLIATSVALSISGEKMPWLLVHIALPAAFLAGWITERLWTRMRWSMWRDGRTWLATVLVLVATVAGLSLLWLIIGAYWPLQGDGSAALRLTLRWLISLAALIGAIWFMGRIPRSLSLKQVALPVMGGLLLLATVRFAAIASYRNADEANEPLIYTQTAPDVPIIIRTLSTLSHNLYGDLSIAVGYDSGATWPMEWYLRDFTGRFNYGSGNAGNAERLQGADVVLVSQDNVSNVEPLLPDYIKHHLRMRPNFPEDYKRLRDVVTWTPDPDNPGQSTGQIIGRSAALPNVLKNLAHYVSIDQYRRDFLDYYWERRPKNGLGIYDIYLFVRPELANEVWQYGLSVAAKDAALTASPYADARVELTANSTLGAGALQQPKDLTALPDGGWAVIDNSISQVVIFNASGEEVGRFGSVGSGPAQFSDPWGIAAAPDGTLFVADTWNHRIQHLTQDGELIKMWGGFGEVASVTESPNSFYGPRDITLDGEGQLYITDTGNKRVSIFTLDGAFVTAFGGEGSAAGQFREPVGISIAPDGTIWVADTWNQRVQGFTTAYQPLLEFAVDGWNGTDIVNKPYIAAGNERVWVSDPQTSRILEFDREGTIQRVWGEPGAEMNRLNMGYGLYLSGDALWVADSGNGRIVAFATNSGVTP